jgi:hypothetical protein
MLQSVATTLQLFLLPATRRAAVMIGRLSVCRQTYDRDEDHMAQFIELLGKIPKKVALTGSYSCVGVCTLWHDSTYQSY